MYPIINNPANDGAMAARVENMLRKHINNLHAEAVELATALEFGHRGNVLDYPLHQFAVRLISDLEQISKNALGELDVL